MKIKGKALILWALAAIAFEPATAANIEPILNNACPEKWSGKTAVVPVVGNGTDPWRGDDEDKAQGRKHIATEQIVDTVDAVPVTTDLLVSDALTVASECLEYRNKYANGENYYPPSPDVTRKTEIGWIASSAF